FSVAIARAAQVSGGRCRAGTASGGVLAVVSPPVAAPGEPALALASPLKGPLKAGVAVLPLSSASRGGRAGGGREQGLPAREGARGVRSRRPDSRLRSRGAPRRRGLG